jgi:predicted dehydrogenase
MESKTYGFGMVGTGLVSQFHGRAIKDSEVMRLVACYDAIDSKAEKFAAQYSCGVESFEDMLKNPEIDIIDVLTPNAYHADFVIRAAAAKKHVMVEKPPEMTLEKTDRMIETCRNNGVKFGVILQCRFRKAIEAMKNAIIEGRFGKLLHASAYMKWFRSEDYYFSDPWRKYRAEGAGVTIQHAFHYLDLLHHLMGGVERLYAKMSNKAHPKVDLEDTLIGIFKFRNGAQGVLEASTAFYPGSDVRVEINGSNGLAVMKGDRIEEWKFKDEKPGDEEIRRIGGSSGTTGAGGAAALLHFEHLGLFEDFVDAIRSNRNPRVTGEEGRRTLATALAMYESAEIDDWVDIHE